MMRLITSVCILILAASLAVAMSAKPPAKQIDIPDAITVFLTGNELGELQPCGCSGGQLGGLDRRQEVLNSIPPSKRLIVDTGSLIAGDSEQDKIKFDIMIQALDLLNYDLVNLTEKDIELARNRGVLDSPIIGFISSHDSAGERISAKFTKKLLLNGTNVAVTVASFNPTSAPLEQANQLFGASRNKRTVNILILSQCDADIIDSLAKAGVVDCLVCPPESDEPMVVSASEKRPLVVSVGRYGKYVGKLQITAGPDAEKFEFDFSAVPIQENLKQSKPLVELYRVYQQLVKASDLLEKQPRFTLPDGLEFTGSKSCKSCHEYEYNKWHTKAHAHAYATLERVGSQFDPECVGCHVVGAEYDSGFVSEQKSKEDLKNVGCENCHGPGSEHIKTDGKSKTTAPRSDCTNCHTPERSVNFAAKEQIYFEKIIHWREPNTADNVKKSRNSNN